MVNFNIQLPLVKEIKKNKLTKIYFFFIIVLKKKMYFFFLVLKLRIKWPLVIIFIIDYFFKTRI